VLSQRTSKVATPRSADKPFRIDVKEISIMKKLISVIASTLLATTAFNIQQSPQMPQRRKKLK